MLNQALDLASLSASYAAGADPADLIDAIYDDIAKTGERPVWISLVPRARALERVAELKRRRASGENLPLFGVPFAVKDNIDIAGVETTAACPAFAYMPERSATVVERLEAAGAVAIGKTNLDQFATGLVGVRSPYGIPSCVFDPDYVSGGSSSGSAVAVASGVVSFSLGTDTAGSGRVPASFNNIVGLKPTKGWVSTRGVVPACRSLDCVSVFAGCVEDALTVAEIAGGFDAEDPYSRDEIQTGSLPQSFRFGVPSGALEFFGDLQAEALFADAVARLEKLGGRKVTFDYAPFAETASLLYAGPWVAERMAAIESFAAAHAEDIHPVVREIVFGAKKFTSVDAFKGQYRLAELTRVTQSEWQKMDVMLLPTAGTIYKIAELLADPVRLNSNLGAYTNFVNLLDLSAIAIPAGFRDNGLPFGVTLLGRAFQDRAVARIAARLHRSLDRPTIGATGHAVPHPRAEATATSARTIEIAVVGAHLSGQPLNHQLIDRGAHLVRAVRSAEGYSLYALNGAPPSRPGLVYDGVGAGGIELELWALPTDAVGSFLAEIAPPLGLGTVLLEDGTNAKGFLCEAHAVTSAANITRFGGWRAYRKSLDTK
jgi:allophanate hydrolase